MKRDEAVTTTRVLGLAAPEMGLPMTGTARKIAETVPEGAAGEGPAEHQPLRAATMALDETVMKVVAAAAAMAVGAPEAGETAAALEAAPKPNVSPSPLMADRSI